MLFGLVKESIFPKQYVDAYNEFLDEKIKLSDKVGEVISYIFYAQHLKIELPLREKNDNGDERLRFGVTLNYIRAKVLENIPEATSCEIHEALDILIDSGSIVPKYFNMSNAQEEEIWVRTFRIGEETIPKKLQALIFYARRLLRHLKLKSCQALF